MDKRVSSKKVGLQMYDRTNKIDSALSLSMIRNMHENGIIKIILSHCDSGTKRRTISYKK